VDSSAAAAAAAAGRVPADLMDALAREFDVRMSLQLAECECFGWILSCVCVSCACLQS
jgi:hypothetical protein